MLTLYMLCAVAGGVVLLLQLALTVLGMDTHVGDLAGDIPHDVGFGGDVGHGGEVAQGDHGGAHNSSWFFGVVSFRSLVAALAFFGLGGLAANEFSVGAFGQFLVALASAVVAMVAVAWLLRMLVGLSAEGTLNIGRALAQSGTVYLTVPGGKAGAGKVLVNVQNRTVEFEAVTTRETLPTGVQVTVVGIVGPNTVEVEAS